MYDDFAAHLGKAIKTFRISNKWTHQELAEKLDVSHNHMQSIENRSKVPSTMVLHAFDNKDMLIASGGTAGYCAVSHKEESPYALEYIQAWLANPYSERILRITGSDFEGGFIARGTFMLSDLPFIELDLSNNNQKEIYDTIVKATRKIYEINDNLASGLSKSGESVLLRQKRSLIQRIESLIARVYRLEF